MKSPITHIARLILAALIACTTLFVSSCHRSSSPTAKRYAFTGRVVSIDAPAESALIDGDNIPGFMDPMAMSYKIKPAPVLRDLAPGDSISAEVVVVEKVPKNEDEPSDYWLENVKVTAHSKSPPAKGDSSLHMPAPGEDVPDFSFTNQDGKRTSLARYKGQVLLVTFIYTRCPFPDFCPRMSGNFAEIYKQLGTNPALADTHLLSISFDPGHDTPKVLRDYAASVAHTHDAALFRHWEFVVPKAADLPKVADFFALTVKPEGGLITHNLSTAVVGRDMKIVNWYHGGDWQVSDLMKDAAAAGTKKVSRRAQDPPSIGAPVTGSKARRAICPTIEQEDRLTLSIGSGSTSQVLRVAGGRFMAARSASGHRLERCRLRSRSPR